MIASDPSNTWLSSFWAI